MKGKIRKIPFDDFENWLIKMIDASGINRSAIAERLNISALYLDQIIKGYTTFSQEYFDKLCDILVLNEIEVAHGALLLQSRIKERTKKEAQYKDTFQRFMSMIRELLYNRKLKYTDVADRIGVNYATLTSMTNGYITFKLDVIKNIAQLCQLTDDELGELIRLLKESNLEKIKKSIQYQGNDPFYYWISTEIAIRDISLKEMSSRLGISRGKITQDVRFGTEKRRELFNNIFDMLELSDAEREEGNKLLQIRIDGKLDKSVVQPDSDSNGSSKIIKPKPSCQLFEVLERLNSRDQYSISELKKIDKILEEIPERYPFISQATLDQVIHDFLSSSL